MTQYPTLPDDEIQAALDEWFPDLKAELTSEEDLAEHWSVTPA